MNLEEIAGKGEVILSFAAGSDLHGAKLPGKSDKDYAGVFVEHPDIALGVDRYEHHISSTGNQDSRNTAQDVDKAFYGLRRWAHLALKGNPTVLGFLWAPALKSSVWTDLILPARDKFIAQKHAYAFLGYGQNQFHRMQGIKGHGQHGQRPELESQFGYDVKAAMHMIRLMYEALELLQEGRITYPRPEVPLLLEIRTGQWSQSRVESEYLRLETEVKNVLDAGSSPLPMSADRNDVSELISQAYLDHWRRFSLI
jgi:predicted nucleotidyltransferase